MGTLSARIVGVDGLLQAERARMFALMDRYYDSVDPARFHADLANKDSVILLEDAGLIQGFSTLRTLTFEAGGRTHRGIFSGDTVVDRPYWGQRVLGRAFLMHLLREKARRPLSPLWWLLITKGYKTYLLMANNFGEHWPRYERATPPLQQSLVDGFASQMFGDDYRGERGLIVHEESLGQLKAGIADPLPDAVDRLPRVAFFLERNPGWAEGHELACIARMTWGMPLKYVLKAWWKLSRPLRRRPRIARERV